MKKLLHLNQYFIGCLFFILTHSLFGQSILTQWNFNASNSTPNIDLNGGSTLVNFGGTTNSYASGIDGTDLATTNQAYNITTFAASGTGNKTRGIELAINTSNYQNLILSFDLRASNTGANTIRVQYSADGTNFTDFERYTITAGSTWFNNLQADFTTVTGVNNNANFKVRLVAEFDPVTGNYKAAAGASTYGTGGTWRFDMITLKGSMPQTITQWNFNSLTPDANTATGTNTPNINLNSATASPIGTTPSFASGTGGTDPAATDNSAYNLTNFAASGTGNKTTGLELVASSLGYQNLVLSFDVRASNTGANTLRVQYSTDGTNFTDFERFSISTGSTWFNNFRADFTTVAGVNNNSNFKIRLVSEFDPATGNYKAAAGASTYGTGGTWRFDMITLKATPFPPQAFTQWNFNSNPSDANTGTGTNTPNINANSTASISNFGGTSNTYATGVPHDPASSGNDNSGYTISSFAAASTGNQTKGIELALNTNNYTNISLYFLQNYSNTAANTTRIQYSTDGTNFTNYVSFMVTAAVWYERLVDFTTVAGVSNNPNFKVRILAEFDPSTGDYKAANTASTYGTSGTWRFDMLSLRGIPLGSKPNLQISASYAPNLVGISSNFQYFLEIKNAGTANTSNVFASISLPATFQNYSVSPAGTTFNQTNGFLTVPTLAANSSAFLTINVTVPAIANPITMFLTADPQNTILESNETDNTFSLQTTLIDLATITKIHTIQTNGLTATAGNYQIEAIVTGVFNGTSGLGGFYVQEEDADADADPNTSEGLFISATAATVVNVGDKVRILGTVQENSVTPSFGQAVMIFSSISTISNSNPLPTAVSVNLPMITSTDFEKYEAMRVILPQNLTVTNLAGKVGRFGEIDVSNGYIMQPSNIANPGAAATAVQNANSLNRLVIDDGRNGSWLQPFVNNLHATNPIRTGQKIQNIQGIMGYGFSAYRVQPTAALVFTGNPRTEAPNSVGSATLKVASVNVLNYFNQFTACPMGVGGATSNNNCRGANNSTEFDRQKAKTVQNILKLGADVYGILEMQNNGYDASSAIQDLVNALNTAAGAGTFAFINADANIGQTNALGTDAIKTAIIYKPAKVTPIGTTATKNNVYPFNTNTRPPLTQAFQENSTGEKFILSVNHFKSKGGCPSTGVDADQNDGQGCWNETRKTGATELLNWLNTNPTGTGVNRILIIGDLNSYAKEDPITTIKNAGYTDLVNKYGGNEAYSYVFDGQFGYLDHALVNTEMERYVTGTADWHINADEIEEFDYNTENLATGITKPANFYNADQFRSSDHDPVLIGLNFTPPTVPTPTPTPSQPISLQPTPVIPVRIQTTIGGQNVLLSNTETTVVESEFELEREIPIGFFLANLQGQAGFSNAFFIPYVLGEQEIILFDQKGNGFKIKIKVVKQKIRISPAQILIMQDRIWNEPAFTPFFGLEKADFEIVSGGATKTPNGQIQLQKFVGEVKLKMWIPETEKSEKSNAVEVGFKVHRAPQTLQFPFNKRLTFGDPDFDLEAQASSSLPITYEVLEGNDRVQISNGKVKILKAGFVKIKTWQMGDEFYSPTESKEIVIFIAKKEQVLNFTQIPNLTFSNNPNTDGVTIQTSANSGLAVKITVSPADIAEVQGNRIIPKKAGIFNLILSQEGNENYLPAQTLYQTQIRVKPTLQITNANLSADGETLTLDYQTFGANKTTFWLINRAHGLMIDLGSQNTPTGKFVVPMPQAIPQSNQYELQISTNDPIFAESALRALPQIVYPRPQMPFLRQVGRQVCAYVGDLTEYKIDWYVNERFFRTTINQNCVEINTFFAGGRVENETAEVYAIIQLGGRRSTASATITIEKENIVTANEESDLAKQLVIYPNPSNGEFRVQLDQKFERLTLRVFDAQGKKVFEKNCGKTLKINELLDLSFAAKGLYFLHLETEKGIFGRKIRVE